MREPDYTGLVEVVRQAVKPNWPDVMARAGRRNRFRRALGALAVAAAVAVGGGAVVATGGDPAPKPAPSPVPTPTTGPRAVVSGVRSAMTAGDLDRFYLVLDECVAEVCTPGVGVSEDRGRTWKRRPAPGAGDSQLDIAAASGRTILMTEIVRNPHTTRWWVSTDAGETWRPSRERRRATVPDDWPTFQVLDEIVALDPRTGDRVGFPVAAVPAGSWARRAVRLADGSRWLVVEPDDYDGTASLVKSRPGGRWATTRLPFGADGVLRDVASTDGRLVYLARVEGVTTLQLYVSRDAGRTWSRGARINDEYPGARLMATDDGTFFLSTATGLYRSTDEGRTLELLGPDGPAKLVRMTRVPGGYTMDSEQPDARIWWSTDATTWTVVRPGL